MYLCFVKHRPPTWISTLSLHDALPILGLGSQLRNGKAMPSGQYFDLASWHTINLVYTRKAWSIVMENYRDTADTVKQIGRDTSELQSRENRVCRLLLEKKKKKQHITMI